MRSHWLLITIALYRVTDSKTGLRWGAPDKNISSKTSLGHIQISLRKKILQIIPCWQYWGLLPPVKQAMALRETGL
jgi:hypothetical protein